MLVGNGLEWPRGPGNGLKLLQKIKFTLGRLCLLRPFESEAGEKKGILFANNFLFALEISPQPENGDP